MSREVLLSLALAACSQSNSFRDVELEGLPQCPAGQGYTRPIVIEAKSGAELTVKVYGAPTPANAAPTMPLPNSANKVSVRVGVCNSARGQGTSLTCAAPFWLEQPTDATIQESGGKAVMPVAVPGDHPCSPPK